MNPNGVTIVSICPFEIKEFKPGLIPDTFIIPAAKDNDISIFPIGSLDVKSRMRVPVVGNVIDMNVLPSQIARSIIEDRNTGQLFFSPEAKPGLFFVDGIYSKDEIIITFPTELTQARLYQKNWFIQLVKLADDDWQKTHQHRFISDIQRYAANHLGLTKDWNLTIHDVADKRCVACFSQMHAQAVICPTCLTNQEDFIANREAKRTAAVPKTVATPTKV